MHDRALVMVGKLPKLVCAGSYQVCGSDVCDPVPAAPRPSAMGCPAGYSEHAPGYWANPTPDTNRTQPAAGVAACGARCSADARCVGFEVWDPGGLRQCHTFVEVMALPFTSSANMRTCVKQSNGSAAGGTGGTGGTRAPTHTVDVLVENRGRSCYGNGMEAPSTGIDRWVQADGQALPGWTVHPLATMANVSAALAPLWAAATAARGSAAVAGPAFYRASFTIAAGELADTYICLRGWGKGMAYVNGHALARYYGVGPQLTHYCPSGFLREGSNELILFETLYPQVNRTISASSINCRGQTLD
jgi:hypothetical protein